MSPLTCSPSRFSDRADRFRGPLLFIFLFALRNTPWYKPEQTFRATGGISVNIKNPFLRLFDALNPRRYKAVKCGHTTKLAGTIETFGEKVRFKLGQNKNGEVQYCLDCVGKMTIKCAWCGDIIPVGSPITLYTPKGDFNVPEHAVVYNEDPLQLVGCLGWDCAETGADRAGFWTSGEDGKGTVHRVPTVFEMMLAGDGKSAVLVNDLSDPKEAANPTLIPLE